VKAFRGGGKSTTTNAAPSAPPFQTTSWSSAPSAAAPPWPRLRRSVADSVYAPAALISTRDGALPRRRNPIPTVRATW